MFKHYYYAEFDIHKDMYVAKKRLHIFGFRFWGLGFGPYLSWSEAEFVANHFNENL